MVRGICSGFGALFGGVGLGASVEVLEHVTGRPLVWATAQFLEFAWPGAVVELEANEIVRGHSSSQARVIARVDGQEIFTVVATLGRRSLSWSGVWAIRPDVPDVADSQPRAVDKRHRGTIGERLEMRMANALMFDDLDGTPGDGRSALWVHFPDGLAATSATLSIVADYVPFGISQAGGRRSRGNSLDNTIRMVHVRPTEWVLADIRVQAVADGFGHGVVHLWAEDGTLLATASQSVIVRDWKADAEEPGPAKGAPT